MANAAPDSVFATNHSLDVFANGRLVGGIAQWGWSQSAQNTRVFIFGNQITDINSARPGIGEPAGVVGGNLTDVQIQFQRMEVWSEAWLEAFGIPDGSISLLGRNLILKSQAPTPVNGKIWSWVAFGARISSVSQSDEASGDRLIRVSGTITAQTMRLLAQRAIVA